MDGFVSNEAARNLLGGPPSLFVGGALTSLMSGDIALQQLCYKRLMSATGIDSTSMNRPSKRVRFSEAPKDITSTSSSSCECDLVKGHQGKGLRKTKIRRTSLDLAIVGEVGNGNTDSQKTSKTAFNSTGESDCSSSSSWYQKSDFRRFLGEATRLVSTCTDEEYLELLAGTYKSCCLEDATDNTLSDQFAEELALNMAASSVASSSSVPPCSESTDGSLQGSCGDDAAADEECARGLERLMSPLLVGCTSKQRRKMAIRAVVAAQEAWSKARVPHMSCHERSELLRLVSEQHTVSAKKFAKALAVVDATSALLEYTG